MRHGHISTLHIWPARRPLAASRATLLAALLRDPGTEEGRRQAARADGGNRGDGYRLATASRTRKETRGGILHWGRESERRKAWRKSRGSARRSGRRSEGGAPRVLDPFAGGGAIPLEAMRLGCEAVAADLNPVAWFILRCTLHYPRTCWRGGRGRCPAFAVREREFVEAFLKAQRRHREAGAAGRNSDRLGHGDGEAAQLTAPAHGTRRRRRRTQTSRGICAPGDGACWRGCGGSWGRAIRPTRSSSRCGARDGGGADRRARNVRYRRRPARLLEPERARDSLSTNIAQRGVRFALSGARRQPTLGGEAAGGVSLGAHGPLRKLPGGDPTAQNALALPESEEARAAHAGAARGRRRGSTSGSSGTLPGAGGNGAQKREHDRTLGAGTMSASGVTCPCCAAIATTKDIRAEGLAGRLGARMTAVVVEGQEGKEYRLPTDVEVDAACMVTEEELEAALRRHPVRSAGGVHQLRNGRRPTRAGRPV